MTDDRRLFPREATDEEIAIKVLSSLLGVSPEEAARIFAEKDETPIGDLKRLIEHKTGDRAGVKLREESKRLRPGEVA